MDNSLWYLLKNKCNPDCLVRIFENLNAINLQQICDLDTKNDQFFTELVYFDVIGKKLVCASSWGDDNSWTIKRTMEIFGGKIKKLKIKTAPMFIDSFVRLFMQHNDVDTLRELQIEIHQRNIVGGNRINLTHEFMTSAIPYFRRLEVLKLDDRTKGDGLERFVAAIVNHSINLRSLSLRGLIIRRLHESLVANQYNLIELEMLQMDGVGTPAAKRQRIRRILSKFGCVKLFICDRPSFALYESIITDMERINFGLVWGEITAVNNFSVDVNNIRKISVTTADPTGSDIKNALEMMAATKQPLDTLRIVFGGLRWIVFGGELEYFPPINITFSRLNTLVLHGGNIRININAIRCFAENIIRPMRGLKAIQFSSLRFSEAIIDALYALPSTLDFQRTELDETGVMMVMQAINNKCGQIEKSGPTNVIISSRHVEFFRRFGNENICITII